MKKIILFLMTVLILMSAVDAYNVMYYSPKINQTECNNIINSIPQEYFNGLVRISVFDMLKYRAFDGEAYPTVIYLPYGCNKELLIHELTHPLQLRRGDTWNQMLIHQGHFYQYQEEITNASEMIA